MGHPETRGGGSPPYLVTLGTGTRDAPPEIYKKDTGGSSTVSPSATNALAGLTVHSDSRTLGVVAGCADGPLVLEVCGGSTGDGTLTVRLHKPKEKAGYACVGLLLPFFILWVTHWVRFTIYGV